jgi:succinate dehydrogenase / fumarate reductase membrane anchor subunit
MVDRVREGRQLVGKGRGGARDWIAVRLNSLALVLLYAWLLVSLVLLLPDFSYEAARGWLRHPLNAVMMILLIVLSFWHAKYGLKEVIDDYVHRPFPQAAAIVALNAFALFGAAFGVWAVVRVALASA